MDAFLLSYSYHHINRTNESQMKDSSAAAPASIINNRLPRKTPIVSICRVVSMLDLRPVGRDDWFKPHLDNNKRNDCRTM